VPQRDNGVAKGRPVMSIAAIIVLALVAAFVIHVMRRPDTFSVERSVEIAAPRARILAQIADLHAWRNWSPWEGRDPALQRTYSGPASGVGATYAWAGNRKAGKGRMEIVAVDAVHVVLRLDFEQPFAASNDVEFRAAPAGAGTRLTWVMRGRNNVMAKLFQTFMNMDRMVGRDFEAGLAALKAKAERSA